MSYTVTTAQRAITLNETDERKAILQNVAMVLGTLRGTVPYYRDFGFDGSVLDRPIPAAKALLLPLVKEAVELYEPRVEVLRVEFSIDEESPGRLVPAVEVELKI